MIRLYLDEDIHEDIAMALRLRGYEVETTKEAGNKGLSNIEQLKYATSEDRTIISCNIADFYELHSEFVRKGINHSGIILTKQRSIGTIVKALLKLISAATHEKIRNQIIWLSDWIN